ncbi:MAG: hypothetical protein EU536_03710 [Promethearchaeota archaeon]|nr:MAG: hypothetical protein EU536_03710 [Candidatus Lokiarchaeota archaeon]
MKDAKQLIHELESRKDTLVQELKVLNEKESQSELNTQDSHQKYIIERELVEIMDRLTQYKFLMKT